MKRKASLSAILLLAVVLTACNGIAGGDDKDSTLQPMVVQDFIEEAKENQNWKIAFATGPEEQIVFMNVSPYTNPTNEIGMERHDFDQVILIVEGDGEAILNGDTHTVQEGSMIFISKDTKHNVINSNHDDPLKLISFYSDTDIPEGSVFKTKADEKKGM